MRPNPRWGLSNPRPSHAYGPEFAFANGTVTKFASRERPQIVLEPATGWPTHLSNGAIPPSHLEPMHELFWGPKKINI